jgi:protein-disulfide isomerase
MKNINWVKVFVPICIIAVLALVGYYAITSSNKQENLKGQVSDSVETEFVNTEGKVVLEEYSDFQCPACANAAAIVSQLKKKHEGSLEVVFNDYPLPYHKQAPKASEAAACAQDQGKFWEYHDTLFANQSEWSGSTNAVTIFKEYAEDLSLDSEKFNQCLDLGEKESYVAEKVKKGNAEKISATPTLYLNGKKLTDYKTWNELIEIIENEINSN